MIEIKQFLPPFFTIEEIIQKLVLHFSAVDSYLEFKRDMGKEKLSEYPDAKRQDGGLITPETLSSEVLKKLSERVNDEVFKSVMVTKPAMFEIGQIELTKKSSHWISTS